MYRLLRFQSRWCSWNRTLYKLLLGCKILLGMLLGIGFGEELSRGSKRCNLKFRLPDMSYKFRRNSHRCLWLFSRIFLPDSLRCRLFPPSIVSLCSLYRLLQLQSRWRSWNHKLYKPLPNHKILLDNLLGTSFGEELSPGSMKCSLMLRLLDKSCSFHHSSHKYWSLFSRIFLLGS